MKVFVQHTRVALISQFQHLRNYCITWCTFASILWILAAFHSITWWEVIEVLMSLRLKSIHPKYFWTSLAWINMRRGASMRQALFEALSARRAHAHQSPSLQSLMTPLLETDQHVANMFQQVPKKSACRVDWLPCEDSWSRTRRGAPSGIVFFLEPWLWLSREENAESWWIMMKWKNRTSTNWAAQNVFTHASKMMSMCKTWSKISAFQSILWMQASSSRSMPLILIHPSVPAG